MVFAFYIFAFAFTVTAVYLIENNTFVGFLFPFFACLFVNNYSVRLVLQALKWNVFHFMNAFAPVAATRLPAPVGILHFLGPSRLTPQ